MQAEQAMVGGSLNAYAEKERIVRRLESTLRQNIDEQIAQLQAQIKQLEETRDRLQPSGILDSRIDDIQRAMRF